jgi:zinc protease
MTCKTLSFKKFELGLVLTLLIPVCCLGQLRPKKNKTLSSAERILPLDTAVRTGRLANGFTYYIRHNENPKNRVIFYLANKVGSILETDDQQGLAHFMEHMSFNGTKYFPKNELVDYLMKSGVRFGADLNAYTGFDETVYKLPVPSDDPKVLSTAIQIVRDWAQEATLDPAEIDKERGVILEEKRLGKGAQERMQRKYWPVILNGSRYANRLAIGDEAVLNNFKPEIIRQYYHDWYRPNLQALIVVGDINVNQMERIIKTKFASLKNPLHEKTRIRYTIPLTGKNQFITVTDKEMTSTVVRMLIKHPAEKMQTEKDYRLAVIIELFNQMLAQRLQDLARKADPPFIAGSIGVESFLGGLDSYSITAEAKPGELEKGFKAVWRENQRIKQFGFSEPELKRAKQTYLLRVSSALRENGKTPSVNLVNEYLQYFLNRVAAPGIDMEYKMVQQQLPGITLAEVNRVLTKYFTGNNRDLMILAPEKDLKYLPGETTLAAWMKAVENEHLEAYKDTVSTKSLLTSEPVPGMIVFEQRNEKLNITTLTLSNGAKVILKPTDFKNDEILLSGYAPGGTSLYNDADFQSAAESANIISSFGAGNYDPQEMGKFLADKKISFRPFISEISQGFRGGAAPKDLETALQLLYAGFTEPRKDTALFKGIISRSKAALTNRWNDPNSVFQDSISAILGNHNTRRMGPSFAKLKRVNLDKAYAIYKERFVDAGNFTFTFVGNFEVDAIKPLIAKYLAALPAAKVHEQARDLGLDIPGGKITKNIYGGAENKATVRLVFSGPMVYSLENTFHMEALKETLEFRLLERLREEESGVYSPHIRATSVKKPNGSYTFIIAFGCAPKNVNSLIASTLDEIRKLKEEGPLAVNVEKYKAEERRQEEILVKTNEFWMGYFEAQLHNGSDLDEVNEYQAVINKVSTGSIKVAANKYLSGDNYIQLVLLPEDNQ